MGSGFLERWERNFTENTVTKYAINERFPEQTFSLKVSPATLVFDSGLPSDIASQPTAGSPRSFKSIRWRVCKFRGSCRPHPTSRSSGKPLKDAIDFIAARYQIPIVVYKADFEAVGCPDTWLVGPIPPGMKVAELLKDTLRQVPQTRRVPD